VEGKRRGVGESRSIRPRASCNKGGFTTPASLGNGHAPWDRRPTEEMEGWEGRHGGGRIYGGEERAADWW
jgi:hypothetical protein